MKIVDVPAEVFCANPEIGQHFVAGINRRFRMFQFKDCLVDMGSLFPIAPNGWACKEMFALYEQQKYEEYFLPAFASRLHPEAPVDRDFAFVFGGISSYHHFLADHLSKIALLASFPQSGLAMPTLVVNDALPEDYLRLLATACAFVGVPQPRIEIARKRILRFAHSYVPCTSEFGPRMDFLRDLGRAIQSAGTTAAPERIFIRRGQVSLRRIENEDELERALQREFGFVAVTTSEMELLDEIRFFKDAKIVIAGHGSALINVIFGLRLRHVIELYVNATQPFYRSMCERWGIDHRFVAGVEAGPKVQDGERRPDNQDYSVDVDAILRLVDSLVRKRM